MEWGQKKLKTDLNQSCLLLNFSSFYCLISLAHEDDDEIKSCLSGAITGALYKSTAGVKKTLAGAAVGLSVAAAW